ncbi:MAG TPA: DUF4386 domain-containing protein [Henriciella marina]|nr:DUF4386 domain-containing protein [Henriciella sp.]HIK66272.1 DUF4386 domain-containing protein [Henriciella marina]
MLRLAGLLYLAIIVLGLSAELVLRGPLIDYESAGATAEAIRASGDAFRLAIVADILMALADAGLAILLYLIFRPYGQVLALSAMVFRLIQSVLIAGNLMNMQAAWLLLSGGQDISGLGAGQVEAMALHYLNLHAHGYDLGLVFFGVNSLLTGALIWRSRLFPRLIGAGIAAAGLVYLIGSALRFLAPELLTGFLPAYGLTILAESAFCIALLIGRARPRAS